MKRFIVLTAGALFCLACAAVSASPTDSNPAPSRAIPVVVHVNDQGRVTSATPAYRVRPAVLRAIRQTLDTIITGPAMKDGKAVSSQFVITLALVPAAKGDGSHGASLKYISSKPLPSGDWLWVHTPDHRLALVNQSNSTINLAQYPSALQRQSDANNVAARIEHDQFMKQVNQGR
jgi:hypothetical protein